MALKKTADGTVDKRTKEGKAIAARMAKARAAAARKKSTSTSKVKKTSDGTVDKRTKEGKAIAARMAKARASRNSLKNRLKRLF
ncbi:MAG: hypothetical protein PUD39_03635 [Bacteroidales bacterium]|nr:hypothetical protein [Bacteroidales bacterium]